MKATKRTKSPYERAMEENERASVEEMKAVQDYNIMMGNLEDPAEEEEEDDE